MGSQMEDRLKMMAHDDTPERVAVRATSEQRISRRTIERLRSPER